MIRHTIVCAWGPRSHRGGAKGGIGWDGIGLTARQNERLSPLRQRGAWGRSRRAGGSTALGAGGLLLLLTLLPATGVAQSPPGAGAYHHWDWGLEAPGLLRFNYAEGVFVGARLRRTTGRREIEARLGWGSTDEVPQAALNVGRWDADRRLEAEVFRRVQSANPWARPQALANSLSALVLGRDEGAYYRALGARLGLSAPALEPEWGIALYAERQRPAKRTTTFSLVGENVPSLGGAAVRAAEQAGVEGWIRGQWGSDRSSPRATASLSGRLETGDVRVAGLRLAGSMELPVARFFSLGWRGGLHVLNAGAPLQRAAFLGGPTTVRGFDVGAAVGTAAFWTGGQAAVRVPLVTIVGFADAGRIAEAGSAASRVGGSVGWIGSLGAGFAVLDDAIRLQAVRRVRGGRAWRLEFYVDPLR